MTRPSQAADPAGDACPVGDAAIIRLSRDEPEQFAALFRLHAPEIRRYVTRRLGADAAEDVVAETFLVAFRQRSGYDLTRADAAVAVWNRHEPDRPSPQGRDAAAAGARSDRP